ncbi:unnamed protein product, partial [Hymenolepis diminuta]
SKEVGDLLQQLLFVQPIQTQKTQVGLACYDVFCSDLLIIIANLTVKFIFQFQGVTRSVSGHMAHRFRHQTVESSSCLS